MAPSSTTPGLADLPDDRLPEGELPDGRRPWSRSVAFHTFGRGMLDELRQLDERMDRDGVSGLVLVRSSLGVDRLTSLAYLEHCGWASVWHFDRTDATGIGITPAGDRVLRLGA